MSTEATKKRTLTFFEHDVPGVKPGDYSIEVEHKISTAAATFSSKPFRFSVAGERFALDAGEVVTVYPPPGTRGEYDTVLPHVMLKRSSLPWERSPFIDEALNDKDQGGTPTSWLAILLFDDGDIPGGPKVIKAGELKNQSADPFWKGVQLGTSTQATDPVTVIDIPAVKLVKLMPMVEDLRLSAHVRHIDSSGANGEEGEVEMAVVLGNRLPRKGGSHTAHLVSLEGLHDGNNFVFPEATDPTKPLIRLVSLKSWSFSCVDDKFYKIPQNLAPEGAKLKSLIESKIGEIRQKLGTQPIRRTAVFWEQLRGVLGLEADDPKKAVLLKLFRSGEASFKGLLLNLNKDPEMLRIPTKAGDPGEEYLTKGCVAAPHFFRRGGKTISYYHGPFTPVGKTHSFKGRTYKENEKKKFPDAAAGCSDELLLLDRERGGINETYTAAWELRRMLALQDRRFSREVFRFKRTLVQPKQSSDELADLPLIQNGPAPQKDEHLVPQGIRDWLDELCLRLVSDAQPIAEPEPDEPPPSDSVIAARSAIPFPYLVPDEEMLPPESIRFFKIDSNWMRVLQEGALSVGHGHCPVDGLNQTEAQSGILLRSSVISGWPRLHVDAYPSAETIDETKKLRTVRMTRLSPQILLCLFDGILKTVDIHQATEILHFGVEEAGPAEEGGAEEIVKGVRNSDGTATAEHIRIPLKDAFRPDRDRVLNLVKLRVEIAAKRNQLPKQSETNFEDAEFAMQMIEGVEKVRFTIQ